MIDEAVKGVFLVKSIHLRRILLLPFEWVDDKGIKKRWWASSKIKRLVLRSIQRKCLLEGLCSGYISQNAGEDVRYAFEIIFQTFIQQNSSPMLQAEGLESKLSYTIFKTHNFWFVECRACNLNSINCSGWKNEGKRDSPLGLCSLGRVANFISSARNGWMALSHS